MGTDRVKIEVHDRRVTIEVTDAERSELPTLVKGLVSSVEREPVSVEPQRSPAVSRGLFKVLKNVVALLANALAKSPSLLHHVTELFK